jgi:hypothetical protein
MQALATGGLAEVVDDKLYPQRIGYTKVGPCLYEGSEQRFMGGLRLDSGTLITAVNDPSARGLLAVGTGPLDEEEYGVPRPDKSPAGANLFQQNTANRSSFRAASVPGVAGYTVGAITQKEGTTSSSTDGIFTLSKKLGSPVYLSRVWSSGDYNVSTGITQSQDDDLELCYMEDDDYVFAYIYGKTASTGQVMIFNASNGTLVQSNGQNSMGKLANIRYGGGAVGARKVYTLQDPNLSLDALEKFIYNGTLIFYAGAVNNSQSGNYMIHDRIISAGAWTAWGWTISGTRLKAWNTTTDFMRYSTVVETDGAFNFRAGWIYTDTVLAGDYIALVSTNATLFADATATKFYIVNPTTAAIVAQWTLGVDGARVNSLSTLTSKTVNHFVPTAGSRDNTYTTAWDGDSALRGKV